MNKINIHHIYHSGFLIETPESILIFDYYKLSEKDKGKNFIKEYIDRKEKPIYVFVSHSHHDHFNTDILLWETSNSKITYILSNDIEIFNSKASYIFVKKNDFLTLNDLNIKVFGSTDIGVSFLVTIKNFNIFHAGDLNWWHWKEDPDNDNFNAEKLFKEELDLIRNEKIDLTFFPVDPRQEEFYFLGGKYFIENIHPKYFVPMHFGDNNEIINSFKNKMQYSNVEILDTSYEDIEILLQ